MNTDTNHLIALLEDEPLPEGYEELPKDLWPAAQARLAQVKARDAYVSKHSGGKLSRYAAGRRAEKRKARRKMARASRRRNRVL